MMCGLLLMFCYKFLCVVAFSKGAIVGTQKADIKILSRVIIIYINFCYIFVD